MTTYDIERYARYKDRHRLRVAEAKERLGGVCTDCGTTDRLQFDHIDPTTRRYWIAGMDTYADATFWAEIEKCTLRCPPCHQQKTNKDGSRKISTAPHGTVARYNSREKCRCTDCRAAFAAYMREYRMREKA